MAWATAPTNPPGWVVAVAGAVFIIFGLAALVAGVRGLNRRRRARRAYLAGDTAPWGWDHPWDCHAARDDVWRRALRRFAWIAFLALFLAPFHYLLLTIEDTTFRVLGGLFLLVFDAAALFTFAGAVKAVMQGLKYGRVFLQYEQFPMLLGRAASVRLMLDRPVDARSVDEKRRPAKMLRDASSFVQNITRAARYLPAHGFRFLPTVTVVPSNFVSENPLKFSL